jgi:hypothetical protein
MGSGGIVPFIFNISTRWEIDPTYLEKTHTHTHTHKIEARKMRVASTAYHAQKLTTELYY